MFSIRSLFYVTALVAALALTASSNGPSWAAAVGFVTYLALIGWYVYRHRNEIVTEDRDQEKRFD